ncbi:hypothetical protein M595_2190 [Lyngbya aestuarii BL J]|uniref:Uncharacterized protein n=2 Tax=Lyngbya aestuarii TaxID=118322 RepID=U7QIP5_9CYAN|nr:hypothetical protein [Lyngbya aestuarii]ERT03623.1 hypothetical protein M595_6440 [Lyngbya aestuarii BL J]ERT07844.1 hypothetical protein M595_2190 [Lyngbya aestuarii BL J]
MPLINLLPGAVYAIVASVGNNNYLTQADRYGLMAAILDDTLSEDERKSVDRLLRAVMRGRIQVIDELSVIN